MNMSNILKVDLNPAQVILSFLLAFALSYLWATVYLKTHSGVAYTRSFYLTLILMAPAVAMIMMAIGSNVALSLGLVGSLSIVRFRTVIKDPKDMLFLFVAIGIGLTAGANAWLVGVIGTTVIGLTTVVVSKLSNSRVSSADYILIFRSEERDPWNILPTQAQKLVSWKQLRSATDVDSGKDFEYTYSVRLASHTSPEKMVAEIGNGKIRQVALLAPENHLDL